MPDVYALPDEQQWRAKGKDDESVHGLSFLHRLRPAAGADGLSGFLTWLTT